jgi:hypothetical protein
MTYASMFDMLHAWQEQSARLALGEISQEKYDQWRYNYPKYDTSVRQAKVPSQELSDFLLSALQDENEMK